MQSFKKIHAWAQMKVPLCNGGTEGWTDKPKAICPFNFFKVGGIKTTYLLTHLKNYEKGNREYFLWIA